MYVRGTERAGAAVQIANDIMFDVLFRAVWQWMSPLRLATFAWFAIAVNGCGETRAPNAASSAAPADITFNRDIAPILFAKCASCHRPGEAAPFSLLSFDDARRRARQIAELTQRRIMPPWLPEPGHGEFAGNRRLSESQIEQIQKWARAGAPEGDPTDLPAAPTLVNGWQLGTPDLVLESPPFTLAAGGGDAFRNFVIPIAIATPQWVESIELRATNPRATHHARLGVDRSFESIRRDAADPEPGYEGMAWGQDPDGQLVTWVPGIVPHRAAPGSAWRLYPKTGVVLHTHMQPTGKTEEVRFQIGVHFASESPSLRPIILRIGSRDIDIRPGDAKFEASDEFLVPVDLDVRSIFPHAHSICRTVDVQAELPDGSQKSLVRISDFNEKWHDDYQFVEPERLPRGTRIRSTFTYDNSDANVRNRRHPPTRVVYGPNAADEMADVYLQVTTVRPDERAAFLEEVEQYEIQSQIVGHQKTLDMYRLDPWSREALAACYFKLGKPQAAIRHLEERLKLGGDPTFANVALANARLASGDASRAEKLCREVLSKDSAYPLAWLGLGKALDAQANVQQAELSYRKAIELAPALTDAHLGLSDNLTRQVKLKEAAAACEEAIRYSPDTPHAHLKLAGIKAQEHQYDDCLRSLVAAQRLAPYTHPPKVLLAVYFHQNGDADKAKNLLREAHADAPGHPVPELFLGQFAAREKRWGDARALLNNAASRAIPNNWPASHKKRFLILLSSERFELAQQLRDEALARAAVDEWIKHDPDNRQLHEIYKGLHPIDIR
jgi:tetratricopeptide (TPR) repeat protein